MPRRRRQLIGPALGPSTAWELLVVSSNGSYPLQLGAGTTRLPCGAEVVWEKARLVLRIGENDVLVNDVAVHAPTALNSGDEFASGEHQYIVLPRSRPQAGSGVRLLDHHTWQLRLEEEVAAAPVAFAILLGRSGAFTTEFFGRMAAADRSIPGARAVLGNFGQNSLEVLLIGEVSALAAFRQGVSEYAARGDETVRWGSHGFRPTARPRKNSGPWLPIAFSGWTHSVRGTSSGLIPA